MKPKKHCLATLLICSWMTMGIQAQGYKDVTSLYITHADQSASTGWTYTRQTTNGETKTWSQICKAFQGSYDTEIYAGEQLSYTTFAAYQTITLPKGSYHLVGKAFQRDVPNTVLFAEINGEKTTTEVVSVYGQFIYGGSDKAPNSMETAAQAFNGNMYLNDLAFTVETDDTPVTIGYEGEFTAAKQWFIFGAMTLYQVQDEVSATYPVDITPTLNRSGDAYTGLTGRYAKANVYIHEKYASANFPLGDQVWQTFTGLENGVYEVIVNADASRANGVGTLPTANPYVYAGDIKASVTAVTQSAISTVGEYTLSGVVVTDGTMRVGFYNQSEGGNWFLYNVKSVKYCGIDLSALVISYESQKAVAKALQDELMNADVKKALCEAIATAETNPQTNSKTWLENAISTLNAAITNAQNSHAAYMSSVLTAVNGMKAQSTNERVKEALQEKYDSGEYATAEDVYAIYQRLEIAALPKTEGADYTSVFINPGFELGTTDGWRISNRGADTGVYSTTNPTYAYSGAEGDFLFNTWDNSIMTLDIGQTVRGLSNGYYTVSAIVAGYGDESPITLTANTRNASIKPLNSDVDGEVAIGHTLTVENVLVYDETLTIMVQNTGNGNTFFKVDAFKLTYIRPYEPMETYTDLHFSVCLENEEVARYLSEVTYTTDTPTAINNYDLTIGCRYDQPAVVAIPLPRQETDATLSVCLRNDFTNAMTYTLPAGSVLYNVTNLIPQHTYYYKVEVNGGSLIANGEIETTGRLRMIKADSGFNIRDIGGWTNSDGNRIRYGKIYRGGEMNAQHVMNAADLDQMKQLGIKAEIDLREDADIEGFGINASAIHDAAYTYENLSRWSEDALNFDNEKFKDAFNLVYKTVKADDAVYLHCIYGADRTGCFAFLLEGLLGLPVDALYKDYELTSFSAAGKREKTGIDHKLQYISALSGATLQEKFYNYWRGAIGISEEILRDFINIMVDGTSPITTAAITPLPEQLVEDGEYYLYLPAYKQLLGRGMAYGTRGVPDRFGIPATIRTNGAGVSTIQFLDNSLFLGSDGFADKAIYYNTVSWFFEQRGDDLILKSLNGKYLDIYEGNRTRVETLSAADATPVVLLSQAEQKAFVAQMQQANILAAAAADGINASDMETLNNILATEYTEIPNVVAIKSATTGSITDWVLSEPYARNESDNYGNAYNVGNYGGELYQKNGSVSQTVTVPHAGLYRLTLNALYRQGTNANCYKLGEAGYDNLSNAYVSINDSYYAQIPSWYSGCTGSTMPNTTDEAKALIEKGKYAVEVYTYIDETRRATITIAVPNFTSLGWCLFNNFALTAYEKRETDGIKIIPSTENDQSSPYTNTHIDLTGRWVSTPTKGIYIVNGKKIVYK